MAILCRDHKLLFVMVPRTGCSAIGGVLQRQFSGVWVPEEAIFRGSTRILDKKHNTIGQLLRHRVLTKAEIGGCLKFATIRNPYDIFASEYARLEGSWTEDAMNSTQPGSWVNAGDEVYRDRLRARKLAEVERARQGGFGKWLKRRLIRLCRPDWRAARWVRNLVRGVPGNRHSAFPMIDGVDELIRYERLEEDFNRILRKAGVEEFISIPHENATPGKKAYYEYYTPELQQLMERYLGDQMTKFGYSLERPAATV